MADTSQSRSSSSPSPSGKLKEANENKDRQFQETNLLDDTLVIDSPLVQSQMENLIIDTEIVEDSEPADDMSTNPLCEYQHQLVLDSEDEEIQSNGEVTNTNGLMGDKTAPVVTNHLIGFRKRQREAPCEQAKDKEANSNAKKGEKGTSIDAECSDEENHQHKFTRIIEARSPVPGESTQANALHFVDHYLSLNKVNLSQGIHHKKATREKSPIVPSARGPQSLARNIGVRLGTSCAENGTFKWTSSDQNHRGAGVYSPTTDASSNFRGCGQSYAIRQDKSRQLENQGNFKSSDSDQQEEKTLHELHIATKNRKSNKELDVQPVDTRENVENCTDVTHVDDFFDIGVNTQIAAEAMEALACVTPLACHLSDAHHPENERDDCPSIVTDSNVHLQNSVHRKSSELQSSTMKSNQRSVFACNPSKVPYSSSCKQTENQQQNSVPGKIRKMTKSKPSVKRQVKSNTSSLICSVSVLHREDHSQGDYINIPPVMKQTLTQNSENRLSKIKDQSSNLKKRNDDVMEKGSLRCKRKRNCLLSDPLRLGGDAKCLMLPSGSGVTGRSRVNCQLQSSRQISVSSSLYSLDSWHYQKGPRGKRQRATSNVQSHRNAGSVTIKGKERQDKVKKLFPSNANPLFNSSNVDSGRCLLQSNSVEPGSAGEVKQIGKLHDHTVAQSGPQIIGTVSSKEGSGLSRADCTCYEQHKKSCSKKRPKSSLLKELIRLGVSESTSDLIWKDLRQRRDIAHIRVLFSQHLDGGIIKKQKKKILARLNLSIASCSTEATHFIADKFTRTKNMLEIMALGKFVVTHLWLESCGQANCLIDEKNYILRDVKKEKEIGFSMTVSLARARQQQLLEGKRVYITPRVIPDKKVVMSLVTTVHGQVVEDRPTYAGKNNKIFDDLLIISCEEDYAICRPFLERGIVVYSAELILNGIVIQKLELERHQLFMTQVTRNKPNTSNRRGKFNRRHQVLNPEHS